MLKSFKSFKSFKGYSNIVLFNFGAKVLLYYYIGVKKILRIC